MAENKIVSRDDWLVARKELLQCEKEFTRQRDLLTQQRQQLPWTEVNKEYIFDSEAGKTKLSDLFDGKSQLIVYHFMFDPDWTEGCKSCSMIADHYDPIVVHLQQRDVALVTVSRAPLKTLLAFRQRMGWAFSWVSSFDNTFNQDFGVTFSPEQLESGETEYNYDNTKPFPIAEAPGISVFAKNEQGAVFHTYSSYARGLDLFLGVYNFLDIVPKGRDEGGLVYSMEWVRHRDRYGDDTFHDPYVQLMTDSPGSTEP